MSDHAYAYFHGFLSGPDGTKALALAQHFESAGTRLHRPALHQPNFGMWTMTETFAHLEAMHQQKARNSADPDACRWRIIGSSLGAWVALHWAQQFPERVSDLVLLCPVLDLGSVLPPAMVTAWRSAGRFEFDRHGSETSLHAAFVDDLSNFHPRPRADVPTRIIHGTQDQTIDIAGSRSWAAQAKNVQLTEVDDDHRLESSIKDIIHAADAWLVPGDDPISEDSFRAPDNHEFHCHWDYFGPTAQATAEHFAGHLKQWLVRAQIEVAKVSFESEAPGHQAVRLDGRACDRERIETALRPRRSQP